MRKQFNMPEQVDCVPRDALSIRRIELDDLISVLNTGLEINTENALTTSANFVKQKLEIILDKNQIGSLTL